MADVGTCWNGNSEEYKVTMEDHFGFSWKEPTGVPPMGEASLVLPPYTASTGSQPEGPDPYLGTRDASNIPGNADRQACKMDDVCSDGRDMFSVAGGETHRPWALGERDLESLYADLHGEDYVMVLDVAISYMAADDPFASDFQVHEAVVCEENDFHDWSYE